jgi:RNA polymerase-binding protein DksA
MSSIDTSRFKDLLVAERERVAAALDNIRNENPGTVEDETGDETQDQHLADAATAMHDRELDYGIAEGERDLLAAIDAALGRIDDGSYGTCTACGRPIAEERLEALPWASLCIDDAKAQER